MKTSYERFATTRMLVSVVYNTVGTGALSASAPATLHPPATVALEVSAWVKQNLGFTPDPQQARVLDTSINRGILNCTRQWGKSTIAAAKAVHQAITKPKSLIIVVSPTIRQSAMLVGKAAEFTRDLDIKIRGDGANQIAILYPNGSRIIGLPGTEGTIRGFSAVSLLLIDEASRVSDELYKAIRPMLAVSNGSLWLMSTPKGKRGFFYEAWMRGDWERVQVPATECPRISQEFLDKELLELGDLFFDQEYLCKFNQAEGALFDRDMLEAALNPNIELLDFPPYD